MRRLVAMGLGLAVVLVAALVDRTSAVEAQEIVCPPIRVMDGFFDRLSMGSGQIIGFVSSPGPTQREYVEKARRLMTPFLCAGARRVAFVDTSSAAEAWVSPARPDLIHVPETRGGEALIQPGNRRPESPMIRAELLHALVHEAAHAAANLLAEHDGTIAALPAYDRLGRRIVGNREWTSAGLEEARRIVERARLKNGFYAEWEQLHLSFVEAGLAAKYHGMGPRVLPREALARSGFTTGYAGDRPGEDIAELTAAITTRRAHAEEGSVRESLDLACEVMRAAPGPGVPDHLAPFFTKVGFLQSVGFISDEDYDDCVGRLKIRGEGSGVFSFDGETKVQEYRGNPRGGIGLSGKTGAQTFTFEADGSVTGRRGTLAVTARLLLTLAPGDRPLDLVSFPRGIYRIAPGSGHSFQIVTEGRNSDQIVVDVVEGIVLVARASLSLVEGSVVVQRASDRTSLLPLPMPQRDRVITFRKENPSR